MLLNQIWTKILFYPPNFLRTEFKMSYLVSDEISEREMENLDVLRASWEASPPSLDAYQKQVILFMFPGTEIPGIDVMYTSASTGVTNFELWRKCFTAHVIFDSFDMPDSYYIEHRVTNWLDRKFYLIIHLISY